MRRCHKRSTDLKYAKRLKEDDIEKFIFLKTQF